MVLNFLWEPLNSGKSTVEREREIGEGGNMMGEEKQRK